MKKGVLYGIGAYFLWGIFPIYWKWLEAVPAIQIISHRIIWSFVLLALILFVTRPMAGIPRRRRSAGG